VIVKLWLTIHAGGVVMIRWYVRSVANPDGRIEVLYFDGCPSTDAFLPRLRDLLARVGATDRLELRRVETILDAERERFLGSPSVRVDGYDIEPGADERTDYGLKCRLYRTENGMQGEPPTDWVLAALGLSASSETRSDPHD
jgi:hypothetical protein